MELTVTFEGLLEWDPALLDSFSLPTQTTRQTVKDALVFLGTDRCCIYADPAAMKKALEAYSAMKLPSWQRIADAMALTYDPIENYDRREEGSYADTHSGTITHTGTEKLTGTETNETSVSAYDTSGYSPRAKEVNTPNTTRTPNLTDTDTTAVTRTFTNYRIHGNIGVTTSQQMLESEVQLALRVNVAEIIVRDLLQEFTFGVY